MSLNAYWRLMRFDKPIGILLLLWPTLWALWVAGQGRPQLLNILIFCLGVTIMRAAGCVMNDIADRDFDRHVARTSSRPLAAGEVSTSQAVTALLILLLLALGLVMLTNLLTIKLALVGALLTLVYPFFKRITHLPQLVLAIAFSWGMIMAFAAETGSVPAIAWWLVAANAIWVVVYDTLYAMVDREDDKKIGIKSTAILFGQYDLLILRILKFGFVGLLAWIGWHYQFNAWFFISLLVVGILFVNQQLKVSQRDPQACFRAFLNNKWVGAAVFVGIAANYLF